MTHAAWARPLLKTLAQTLLHRFHAGEAGYSTVGWEGDGISHCGTGSGAGWGLSAADRLPMKKKKKETNPEEDSLISSKTRHTWMFAPSLQQATLV